MFLHPQITCRSTWANKINFLKVNESLEEEPYFLQASIDLNALADADEIELQEGIQLNRVRSLSEAQITFEVIIERAVCRYYNTIFCEMKKKSLKAMSKDPISIFPHCIEAIFRPGFSAWTQTHNPVIYCFKNQTILLSQMY